MSKIYNRYTKEEFKFDYNLIVEKLQSLISYSKKSELLEYALENLSSHYDAYECIVDIRTMKTSLFASRRNETSINACFEITILKVYHNDLQDFIEYLQDEGITSPSSNDIFENFEGYMEYDFTDDLLSFDY